MNKRLVLGGVIGALTLILLATLVIGSLHYFLSDPDDSPVKIDHVTAVLPQESEAITLPHEFKGLAARTPVSVSAVISPRQGGCVYVKSVYAPIRVYANGNLVYEYGKEGTYPSWMADPATMVKIIKLPQTGEPVCLRVEYFSPSARSTLTIHPFIVGDEAPVFRALFQTMGFSFFFSLLMLFFGVFLVMITALIRPSESRGIAFAWLGLFAISVSAWTFGECNLTGLLIQNPTLLYLLAFCGMFAIPIPLLRFGLVIVDFHKPRPLYGILQLLSIALCAAMLLQLLGVVPLSDSMYAFHILAPVALCAFAGHVMYESLHYQNITARRLLAPIGVLALSAVLEVINYRVYFTYTLSLFFQIGVLIFVMFTGIIGGIYIRDTMRLRQDEQRLRYEMQLMEYRMEEERKHQKLLLANQETVKAQRHDLRHQLAVLRSFSKQGDNTRLNAYLDSLVAAIPSEQGRNYCENAAVNAIVSHYAAEAEANGIELSIRLAIPEHTEQISNSNLCVILGNLFENAIEACVRMTDGHQFIRLGSRLQYGTLTITMDNSFDGKAERRGEPFLSSKRDEVGTGLRSVAAIAERHGGGADFKTDGKVFLSSVYVRL